MPCGSSHLYAEKQPEKFERAAMKWLRRYLDEKEPTLCGASMSANSKGAGPN